MSDTNDLNRPQHWLVSEPTGQTKASTGPSKEALEAAREYIGKPSPAMVERPFYEEEVLKLAQAFDSFARRGSAARLNEHDLCCQAMSYGINTTRNLRCGQGWSCHRRRELERIAQLEKEKG